MEFTLINASIVDGLIDTPALITGLITAIIIGIYTIFHKKLLAGFKKIQMIDPRIAEQISKRYTTHFIPNRVFNGGKIYDNGITYLTGLLLGADPKPLHLITAPTGLGKTTFLANLYLEIKHRHKNAKVAFGIMYHENSKQIIEGLISSGKAAKTILLIDALDEFIAPAGAPDLYWSTFIKTYHDFINQQAVHFKKVVITVREQFLQTDELSNRTLQVGIDKFPPNFITLLPFDANQQDEYLTLKHPGQKNSSLLKDLHWLTYKMRERNLTIVEVPLVLNNLEDVLANYSSVTSDGKRLTSERILRIIVENWLTRESAKGVDQVRLRKFCEDLAFEIARRERNGHIRGIVGGGLIAFEQEARVLEGFSGWGDRSLLQKFSSEDSVYFGFVSNEVMEFFLVDYINRCPQDEIKVPLIHFKMAMSFLIAQRLPESNKKLNAAYHGMNINRVFEELPAKVTLQDVEDLISLKDCGPSSKHMIELSASFDHLFSDQQLVNEVLLSKIEESLIIAADDSWRPILEKLSFIHITNFTFRCANQSERQLLLQSVQRLKRYISGLCFVGKVLEDNELKYLDGVDALEYLMLTDADLSGDQLKAFSKSIKLISVVIRRCQLKDDDFSAFSNCDGLRNILVDGCNLDGTLLRQFKASAHTVRQISLIANRIEDASLSYLSDFVNLERVLLNGNRLVGSGLQSLLSSKASLKYLWIQDNRVIDQHLHFLNELDIIHTVDLRNNAVHGVFLSDQNHFCTTISILNLSENPLNEDVMASLPPFSNLTSIDLSHCSLTGSGLRPLIGSKRVLETLYLSSNRITGEHLQLICAFQNLKYISLSDNNLSYINLDDYIERASSQLEIEFSNNDITDAEYRVLQSKYLSKWEPVVQSEKIRYRDAAEN
ncbi:hypothetical protein [Pedobacter sp. JY14-1]|uniref:hypothetical protein n=1 Tax=Pedobacter sp. JY14-1 TaxID=3034151 RepID=UPI0023E199ED|nr:hypothetical protein [Pedobacter sp. JY14-1]